MSGHLANPIPDTRSEPKFCVDISDEHTPINLPDSNRNFPHEYDATIVPRHSGASSSWHTAAASRVLPVSKLGSLGNRLTNVFADYDSVDSRNGAGESCAHLD